MSQFTLKFTALSNLDTVSCFSQFVCHNLHSKILIVYAYILQLCTYLRNLTKSLYSLRDSQGRERPNIKNACLPCSNISSNSMTNYGPPDMHYTAPAPTASSTYSSQLEDQKGSSLSHSSYNSHYGTLPRPRKHSSQYSEAEKSGIVVSSYATLPRQRRWVG